MANWLFALIVLLSPLTSNAQQASRPPGTRDLPVLLHAADDALARRDYAAAVKALKPALEIDPRSPEAWFSLAYAYTGLHQNDDAVQAYQRSLELRPDLFEARLNLGILLFDMNRPRESLDHLAKAAALRPTNSRAHLYYGRALAQAGQRAGAEKQLGEAARLEPALAATSQFELGQLYLAEKGYADARQAFEKASALDPKLQRAQLGMGLAEEGLQHLAEATASLERYLAAQPEDVETQFHLARIYLQSGQAQKALEHLQVVDKAKPDIPGLAAALGDAYALLKRFPESERSYRAALAPYHDGTGRGATPGESELHRALGRTLLDEKEFIQAEQEFRTALKLDPKNLEAFKGLATSLYLEKRYGEAIPLLVVLTRRPAAPPGLFFVLASCYDHLGARPEALHAYQRFLELSHDQSPDQEWQARQRVKLLERELSK